MIKYPESNFFQHTDSQKADVVVKIIAATIKKGSEAGGFAKKHPDEEFFIYTVQTRDGQQKEWTVKAASQVGGELSRKNVQTGDVIKIHFLGMVMPTDYGMKAKYEILKKGETPAPVAPVNDNLEADAREVFNEEVSIEDDF